MYYDKTQVILKKQIVEFEADKKSDKELDDSLIEIWEKLVHLTDEEWANYIKKRNSSKCHGFRFISASLQEIRQTSA